MLPVRDVVTVVGRRLAGVPKQVAGSRKSATAGGAFDGRCLLALNTAMQCIETIVGELLPARRAAADFESRRLRPRYLMMEVRGRRWDDALIVVRERWK